MSYQTIAALVWDRVVTAGRALQCMRPGKFQRVHWVGAQMLDDSTGIWQQQCEWFRSLGNPGHSPTEHAAQSDGLTPRTSPDDGLASETSDVRKATRSPEARSSTTSRLKEGEHNPVVEVAIQPGQWSGRPPDRGAVGAIQECVYLREAGVIMLVGPLMRRRGLVISP